MTTHEFKELGKSEQQQLLQQEGVKLGEKIQSDFNYQFYQLGNFYVELKIQQHDSEELVGLQTFDSFNEGRDMKWARTLPRTYGYENRGQGGHDHTQQSMSAKWWTTYCPD